MWVKPLPKKEPPRPLTTLELAYCAAVMDTCNTTGREQDSHSTENKYVHLMQLVGAKVEYRKTLWLDGWTDLDRWNTALAMFTLHGTIITDDNFFTLNPVQGEVETKPEQQRGT